VEFEPESQLTADEYMPQSGNNTVWTAAGSGEPRRFAGRRSKSGAAIALCHRIPNLCRKHAKIFDHLQIEKSRAKEIPGR
jgi:hypothetical protein